MFERTNAALARRMAACAVAAAAAALLGGCSQDLHSTSPAAPITSESPARSTTTAVPAPSSTPSVTITSIPSGPVTPAELGSPEAAAVAWLSRWCSYDYRDSMGTGENLSHPAMTERGWLAFDPLTAPTRRAAWSTIVAERDTATCSAPTAIISPEAPRSSTGAYVIVTAQRVVTPEGGAPRVEQVRETRQVLFRESRWLVDIAANGAG